MYHRNRFWQECEAVKTLGFPKDICNTIIMYLDGTAEYETLTDVDPKEIMKLIKDYECVIHFEGKDYEIIQNYFNHYERQLTIGFMVEHIQHQFIYHMSDCNSRQRKHFGRDQYYWHMASIRYKKGGFTSTWRICDVDKTLRLRFGKKRIGLWQRIKNIFKK